MTPNMFSANLGLPTTNFDPSFQKVTTENPEPEARKSWPPKDLSAISAFLSKPKESVPKPVIVPIKEPEPMIKYSAVKNPKNTYLLFHNDAMKRI